MEVIFPALLSFVYHSHGPIKTCCPSLTFCCLPACLPCKKNTKRAQHTTHTIWLTHEIIPPEMLCISSPDFSAGWLAHGCFVILPRLYCLPLRFGPSPSTDWLSGTILFPSSTECSASLNTTVFLQFSTLRSPKKPRPVSIVNHHTISPQNAQHGWWLRWQVDEILPGTVEYADFACIHSLLNNYYLPASLTVWPFQGFIELGFSSRFFNKSTELGRLLYLPPANALFTRFVES